MLLVVRPWPYLRKNNWGSFGEKVADCWFRSTAISGRIAGKTSRHTKRNVMLSMLLSLLHSIPICLRILPFVWNLRVYPLDLFTPVPLSFPFTAASTKWCLWIQRNNHMSLKGVETSCYLPLDRCTCNMATHYHYSYLLTPHSSCSFHLPRLVFQEGIEIDSSG